MSGTKTGPVLRVENIAIAYKVRGSEVEAVQDVSFEIERAFGDAKFVTKYRGQQTGNTIKGTMELETSDYVREGEWEAKRVD